MASTTSPIGSEMDREVRIIVGSPNTSAASDTTRIGTSNDADFSISHP